MQASGECLGTCPKCEAEVRYLERELEKRQRLGKAVTIAGLAMALSTTAVGCDLNDVLIRNVQGNMVASESIESHQTLQTGWELDGEALPPPGGAVVDLPGELAETETKPFETIDYDVPMGDMAPIWWDIKELSALDAKEIMEIVGNYNIDFWKEHWYSYVSNQYDFSGVDISMLEFKCCDGKLLRLSYDQDGKVVKAEVVDDNAPVEIPTTSALIYTESAKDMPKTDPVE